MLFFQLVQSSAQALKSLKSLVVLFDLEGIHSFFRDVPYPVSPLFGQLCVIQGDGNLMRMNVCEYDMIPDLGQVGTGISYKRGER